MQRLDLSYQWTFRMHQRLFELRSHVVCMCPSAAMSSQYKCQPIWSSLGIAETMSTMSICCRNCGDGCSSGITGILKARQSLSIQIHLPSFAMVVVSGHLYTSIYQFSRMRQEFDHEQLNKARAILRNAWRHERWQEDLESIRPLGYDLHCSNETCTASELGKSHKSQVIISLHANSFRLGEVFHLH